ncbi:MAG: DUF4252 domain-containing protein [Saprospiraceae bacterium]|nr:DUF4252 domain-containing protein [Saprospiraceae bacterium]
MKYVKIISLAIAMLFVAGPIMAQTSANAIEKYFTKYLDDERFTVVYISPKLFKMFEKLDIAGMELEDDEAEAIMDLVKDLEGLRILTAEEDAEALYKEAKSKINTKEYEVLMTVRTREGNNVEFLVKDDGGDIIKELLLLTGGGGDEFVLLSFVGNIDIKKISKLANTMEN